MHLQSDIKMSKSFRNNTFDKTYKILPDKHKSVQENVASTSKPLHVQAVEMALNVDDFLKNVNKLSVKVEQDDSDDSSSNKEIENLLKESETYSNKDYYNFSSVSSSRKWLADIMQENTDMQMEESNYHDILKMHMYHKAVLKNNKNLDNFMYYGSGLLSNIDKYPEIEKTLPVKIVKKKIKEEPVKSSPLFLSDMLEDISNDHGLEVNFDNGLDLNVDEDSNINSEFGSLVQVSTSSQPPKKRTRKFKDEESKKKWEDLMTIKRKKVFTNLVKKEIGKQHRSKINRHKEVLLQCKRVAQQCLKHGRQKALLSARIVKEQQWRMKRLSRENLAYWKRSRRLDREFKKKLEKEAEEQRKMDHEMVEAKRQQRKLNFLITQTELYAHFMSKKLGQASPEEQLRILSQLEEEKSPRLSTIDDYDSDAMKERAKRNAHEAFQNEKARTKHFDLEANSSIMQEKVYVDGENPQPAIFQGKLKGYQLRGMNWLANLYAQGISGILADEMGLGKTVQSIAFLCHIAERYSVWGPFLIISPASTLHNWQQEIAKFVPEFKVVPYWGNPNERKILRQFWDQKDIYTKDASFHIVVTSYQIVITDIKYFNRIKWQYMILDEAQAIKSTSSMRWKTLLGFSCRNRLLLSGTPIQNSMAELWALLHFIMPTLFDSHEEFNEWFSKDIENHAENKTGIDEKHLSRLHMILKPFMLRRIKKDVEYELSDKIEVMVYCPLTTRQKLLYMALKQKIKIEDLLHYTVGGGDSHTVDKNFTSNLMNLVMQFRKVCNHPELFERRDAKSPIYLLQYLYEIPRLIYDFNISEQLLLKIGKYFTFTPEYIAHAVQNDHNNTIFNICMYLNISVMDLFQIFSGNLLHRWKHFYDLENYDYITYQMRIWNPDWFVKPNIFMRNCFKLCIPCIKSSDIFNDLIFTGSNTGSSVAYTFSDHYYHSMAETVEHKNIRCKHLQNNNNNNANDEETIIDVVTEENVLPEELITKSSLVKDFIRTETPPRVRKCEKTEIPGFLLCFMPKVVSSAVGLYCYSRKAAWDIIKQNEVASFKSTNYFWSVVTNNSPNLKNAEYLIPHQPLTAFEILRPINGWSYIAIPDKETLVTDSGKLSVLDSLLKRLKEGGHRVLIYSQMTKMIDLLEEYMWHRHHKYMRLDGSSKISERRDMVADFQARTDIFVFLLSTRAGGLGINLTAADTVIFYDSDWNPTVDQQAMDRAHRLGQTKQVTVYRLICKGSIEERILQRAREKSEIQKLVISGGNFKPDTLKPKEVVSLLLDDEELVQKYHLKVENGTKQTEESKENDRKRKYSVKMAAGQTPSTPQTPAESKISKEDGMSFDSQYTQWNSFDSGPNSPTSLNSPDVSNDLNDVNDAINVTAEDQDSPITNKYTVYNVYGSTVKPRIPGRGTSRRGRPRGSRRVNSLGRFNTSSSSSGVFVTESGSGNTSPASSTSSVLSNNILDPTSMSSSGYSPSSTVRRGPGRPRLKPSGPSNSGSRGVYRPRKPAKPLPVPLPTDGPATTSSTNSTVPTTSSYVYDFDVLYAKSQND